MSSSSVKNITKLNIDVFEYLWCKYHNIITHKIKYKIIWIQKWRLKCADNQPHEYHVDKASKHIVVVIIIMMRSTTVTVTVTVMITIIIIKLNNNERNEILPVNDILSISGCWLNGPPVSGPSPVTTLNAPSGRPS